MAGIPGQNSTFLDDDAIPLQANAVNNVAIDRVEFYHNGDFVGVDEAFPYGYDHSILRTGEGAGEVGLELTQAPCGAVREP
jgi:hypothetical protein